MPRITFATVFKLLLWSFAIGALMAFFHLTPHDLGGWAAGWFQDLFHDLQLYASRAFSYILLGAVVVVPVWAVVRVWRALR